MTKVWELKSTPNNFLTNMNIFNKHLIKNYKNYFYYINYLYLKLYNQLLCTRSQLIILIEFPEDNSTCIRSC